MVDLPNIDYYKFVVSGIQVQMRYLAILITVNGITNSKDTRKSKIYTDDKDINILLRLISQLISEVSIVVFKCFRHHQKVSNIPNFKCQIE